MEYDGYIIKYNGMCIDIYVYIYTQLNNEQADRWGDDYVPGFD